MGGNRFTRWILILVVITMLFAPTASATPRSQLCNVQSWRDAHPDVCAVDGPLPRLMPGGGGPDDGLIGRILKGLGGLL